MTVTNPQQATDPDRLIGERTTTAVSTSTTADIRRTLAGLGQPERADGHLLILPTVGHGFHSVDFRPYKAAPGMIIHVQPGQVHRWHGDVQFEAELILIRPDLCPPGLFSAAEPQPDVVLGTAHHVVLAVASDLRRELESHEPDPAVVAASASLLLHHTARVGRDASPPEEPTAQTDLLRSFRTELEGGFDKTRSVSEYARRIGTSPKTLSRVTASLVGKSPKELIDQRVTLEACRMLAHSTESASSIGASLGFSEPTNFTKFFARHTGASPQEFRAKY